MSRADRLFSIPMGRSLPKGLVRFEALTAPKNRFAHDEFLAFSPLSSLEFELRNRDRNFESNNPSVDVSYNLVTPIAGLAPGISVGVLDATNETDFQRRAFIAITFRELFDVSQAGEYGDLTFGYQFGSSTSGFVGAQIS